MKKSAFITNFMGFYNLLWAAVLPFLRHHPRLTQSFDPRTDPAAYLVPTDIWIQAASAGEALLAGRLVQRLSPKKPVRILVTTTTDQGMDILGEEFKKNSPNSHISLSLGWFPFDCPAVTANAVKKVAPKVMVLLETELWPALLYHLRQHQTRILVVNGRMSAKSSRHYRMTKPLWTRISPHHILAVSDMDAKRFQQVFDPARVTVMPNMKFETLTSRTPETTSSALTHIFPCPLPMSVFASIRRQEERQVLKMIHSLFDQHPRQVIALFPRHMHRLESWKRRLTKTGVPVFLRSKLSAPPDGPGIILWDLFGEMRQVFNYAHAVFMGGSLKPLGGQNFLEPLLQGAPVVTGPFWDDFLWVGNQVFDLGLAQRTPDWRSAAQAMGAYLKHPQDPDHRRQKVRTYVQSRSGGTDMACRAILAALSDHG
ncbi:MAG: glycosyltransferase N-terminal domain-containing protein [Desulfotignum sp.]|nr:glycosyltransferase N-terminal domain-containing protein [Desulfotignum sp.]